MGTSRAETGEASKPAHVLRVPTVPSSVAAARRYAATVLHDEKLDALSDTVMLLLSEIVTNAITHGTGIVEVSLIPMAGALRAEVADESSSAPAKKDLTDDQHSGRGLALVDAMASSWGWEARVPGKMVWFEVRQDA